MRTQRLINRAVTIGFTAGFSTIIVFNSAVGSATADTTDLDVVPGGIAPAAPPSVDFNAFADILTQVWRTLGPVAGPPPPSGSTGNGAGSSNYDMFSFHT